MTAPISNSGDSNNSVPLSIEETLEAIGNQRRRFTIRFVDEMAIPVEVGNLAGSIATIENDRDQPNAQERKRVYIALTQNHLDKLNNIGAIAYDDQEKILMPSHTTHRLADLVRYLESVCTTE